VLVGFSGPISVEQALEKSLPRLAEVHLHDGPWQGREGKVGYGQDHRTLGQGDLDIAAFMKALEEVNFEGPVIFELQLPEALASMKVIEDLGWAD
jgi:sugar phosphate isomerase/epimerase